MGRGIALLFILLLLPLSVTGKEVKRDPESGMIRVLYIGAPFWTSPYQFIKFDPLLSTTPVSGNLYGLSPALVARSMRLYMPRSREAMVSNYDIIGLDDATFMGFPPNTVPWMTDGCIEDGLGIFMGGGHESFGGGAGFPSWGGTDLDRVLPVECTGATGPDGRSVIMAQENPFIRSVPWDEYEQHNIYGGYNVVKTKDGADQLSRIVRLVGGQRDPGWVWWDVGSGRFFASAGGFRGASAERGFLLWKHYPDFVSNMVYFVAGLEPPSDVSLLYEARARFRDIYHQRQIVIGAIEFITKFGADPSKVDRQLLEAEEGLREARSYFVDLELAESKEVADRVFLLLQDGYQLALEARDTALFWIFVTEWLVVTGTGLICGFALWTLMVKRSMYTEVKVTRGGRS
jgi:hypothetical protein